MKLEKGEALDGTLLDGHNRYEICERLELPFETAEIDLADRDAAKVWIVNNQLGRRNLPVYLRGELLLAVKPQYEKKARKRMEAGVDPVETLPQGKVRDQLGKLVMARAGRRKYIPKDRFRDWLDRNWQMAHPVTRARR